MKIKQLDSNFLITENDGSIKHILPKQNTFFHQHPIKENAILISTGINLYDERAGITLKASDLTEVDASIFQGFLSRMLFNLGNEAVFTGFEPYYPILKQIEKLVEFEQTLNWYKENANEPKKEVNLSDGKLSSVSYTLAFSYLTKNISTALQHRYIYRADKPNLIKYEHLTSGATYNVKGLTIDLTPNMNDVACKVYLYDANDNITGYQYKSINDVANTIGV